jgi:drug/metabolite transporter (DMT)-like permease
MKHLLVLISVLGVVLAAALYLAIRVFTDIDAQISWHGWLAMGLAVFFTAALGGGLMYLVFYSARNGHDDVDHEL